MSHVRATAHQSMKKTHLSLRKRSLTTQHSVFTIVSFRSQHLFSSSRHRNQLKYLNRYFDKKQREEIFLLSLSTNLRFPTESTYRRRQNDIIFPGIMGPVLFSERVQSSLKEKSICLEEETAAAKDTLVEIDIPLLEMRKISSASKKYLQYKIRLSNWHKLQSITRQIPENEFVDITAQIVLCELNKDTEKENIIATFTVALCDMFNIIHDRSFDDFVQNKEGSNGDSSSMDGEDEREKNILILGDEIAHD